MCRLALTLAVCTLLGAASGVQAETVEIGSQEGPFTTVPFGTNGAYLGQFQQIYSGESFAGAFEIRQIAFASIGGGSRSATYNLTVGLGTSNSTPSAPSADFDTNKGADFANVFSGSLTSALFGTGQFDLIIDLTNPFLYDPSGSDLLLDVVINSATSSDSGSVPFVAGFAPEAGWVTLNGAEGGYGLRTRFADDAGEESIPEPTTMILLGTGLAGVAAKIRRRRKNSDA